MIPQRNNDKQSGFSIFIVASGKKWQTFWTGLSPSSPSFRGSWSNWSCSNMFNSYLRLLVLDYRNTIWTIWTDLFGLYGSTWVAALKSRWGKVYERKSHWWSSIENYSGKNNVLGLMHKNKKIGVLQLFCNYFAINLY